MSYCMQHVFIGDTVLAGARLNVHKMRLRPFNDIVNIY